MDKEKLIEIILGTCEKELNQTIGFMLTKNEAEIFAQSLIDAGYIHRDEVEIDEEKLFNLIDSVNCEEMAFEERMYEKNIKHLAHAIATNKEWIK